MTSKYEWSCPACETVNSPEAETCARCGCPAVASGEIVTLFKGNHPIPSDKANTLLERAAELSGIRGYVIAAASFSVAAGVMLLRVSFSLYSNLTGISLMIAEIGVLALSSVGSGRKR